MSSNSEKIDLEKMSFNIEKLDLEKLKSDIINSPERSYLKSKKGIHIYEITAEGKSICSISQAQEYDLWPFQDVENESVKLMLIGETGKGKTTLVNGILNFLMGVSYHHVYRFSIPIYISDTSKCEADSQTEVINLYNIPYVDGMQYKTNFVIIDTPGLLDTRGSEFEQRQLRQMKSFLDKYIHKGKLHIGIVTEANLTNDNNIKRLVNEIKDIVSELSGVKIISIATFADIFAKPTCHSILTKNKVKCDEYFKINNGIIFSNSNFDVEEFPKQWSTWKEQITMLIDYTLRNSDRSTLNPVLSAMNQVWEKTKSLMKKNGSKMYASNHSVNTTSSYFTTKSSMEDESRSANISHMKRQNQKMNEDLMGVALKFAVDNYKLELDLQPRKMISQTKHLKAKENALHKLKTYTAPFIQQKSDDFEKYAEKLDLELETVFDTSHSPSNLAAINNQELETAFENSETSQSASNIAAINNQELETAFENSETSQSPSNLAAINNQELETVFENSETSQSPSNIATIQNQELKTAFENIETRHSPSNLAAINNQFREDEISLLAYVTVDKPSSISSSTINSLKNPGTDGSRSEGGVSGQLEQLFRTAVLKAYPEAEIPNVVMTKSEQADYQCNTPIGLAKKLKKNPHEVGQEIIEHVPSNPLIEKLEVSGPGFINIMLSKDFIRKQITNIIMHGVTPPTVSTKHVVVDFFSPNVGEEIALRHLRSAIIGDSICRLLEFLGHKVTRLNHLGDWGTHVGMLIAHLNNSSPGFATRPLAFEDLRIFYEESMKRFNTDKAFKKQAYEAVVKLQSGDPEHIKGWTEICNISRRECKKCCTAFDIKITDRGESFYQSRMENLVKELEAAGHLQHFNGRKIMFGEDVKSILTVVQSDGGFTYDTSDLACLKQRIVEEKADWVIYVVTTGDTQHLKKIFCCGQKAGFYDPSKVRVDIVDFYSILGEDGRKFEKILGNHSMALLNEGAERAEDKLKENGRDKVLTPEEFRIARDAVAYGCIKYAELSHDRTMDYTFSFDQMLNFRGNTAAYLLYALKQIRSIGRTAEVSRESLLKEASKGPVELAHEREWNLARTLMKLPDVLVRITEDLHIHPLCEYLYEVSSVFAEFYDVCYCVEKDKEGNIIKVNMSRMILCEATAAVMEQCFTILGIKTVEKM